MTMATAKKSKLDELVDTVTIEARPHAGAPVHDEEAQAKAATRELNIETTMRVSGVPKAVAIIMVDRGYSKGTAYRIHNDEFKRQTRAREAAHAAQQAKGVTANDAVV
jgi:hypothetical protein